MEIANEVELEERQTLLRDELDGGFKRCAREIRLEEFDDKFVFRSADLDVPYTAFSVDRSEGFIQSLEGSFQL